MFKILNGYENIDSNILFKITEMKITKGHNYTLVKKKVDWTSGSITFPRGPSMYVIHYQLTVYLLVY